jgi:hypothetical protein
MVVSTTRSNQSLSTPKGLQGLRGKISKALKIQSPSINPKSRARAIAAMLVQAQCDLASIDTSSPHRSSRYPGENNGNFYHHKLGIENTREPIPLEMLRFSTRSNYFQNAQNSMHRSNLIDNPDYFITQLGKRVSGLDYSGVLNGFISEKAKLDLKIPRDQVKIPENLLNGIKAEDTSVIEKRKEEYLNYREELLTNIAERRVVKFKVYTDGDGSLIDKAKDPSNTHVWGEEKDFHNRIILAIASYLGYGESINITTQRSGFPNQNVITKKSEDGSIRKNYEVLSGTANEFGILNPFDERGNLKDLYFLLLNTFSTQGFAGGIHFEPSNTSNISRTPYPLIINQMNNFIKTFEQMNKGEDGIVNQILKAAPNATVIEYKGIPRILNTGLMKTNSNIPEHLLLYKTLDHFLTLHTIEWVLRDYVKREEQGLGKDFKAELNDFKKRLYFNGIQDIPKIILDPEALESEGDFKKHMRLASLMLRKSDMGCFTLHLPEKEKYQVFKTIAEQSRKPEMKEWAKENFGLDKDEDIFSIQGYDFSGWTAEDIGNLNDKKFKELINDNKIQKVKDSEKRPMLIIDNFAGYIEITSSIQKNHLIDIDHRIRQQDDSGTIIHGIGDSKSTDGPLLQATLNPTEEGEPRGYANIVGNRIDPNELIDELMAKKGLDQKANAAEIKENLLSKTFIHPNVSSLLAFQAGPWQELLQGFEEIDELPNVIRDDFNKCKFVKPVDTTRIIKGTGNSFKNDAELLKNYNGFSGKEADRGFIEHARNTGISSLAPLSHIEPEDLTEEKLNKLVSRMEDLGFERMFLYTDDSGNYNNLADRRTTNIKIAKDLGLSNPVYPPMG